MTVKQKNKPPAPETPSKGLNSLAEAYRKLAPYLNIGYVMAASIALFTWLGYFLDKRWQTFPWLTITGAVLGIVTGFYNFFKTVFLLDKKNQNRHPDEN